MNKIINSCIEVLQQGERFLKTVSPASYQEITRPYFISSPGEHMRHILDHFIAIQKGLALSEIDYDLRQRGSNIETDKNLALIQLKEIRQWLLTLNKDDLNKTLKIKTEVSVIETSKAQALSSLERELIFAASHAAHHFSIISIAMQMQDLKLDHNFGIAPATATYLRTENSCAP